MKKDDLIAELEALRAEKESDLIPWDKQLTNFKARLSIHNKEIGIAIEDLKNLGQQARLVYEDIKEFSIFKES